MRCDGLVFFGGREVSGGCDGRGEGQLVCERVEERRGMGDGTRATRYKMYSEPHCCGKAEENPKYEQPIYRNSG